MNIPSYKNYLDVQFLDKRINELQALKDEADSWDEELKYLDEDSSEYDSAYSYSCDADNELRRELNWETELEDLIDLREKIKKIENQI